MRDFDEKLLRLKQALQVSSDQDVAAALGMTKAAFSERKRRDAFPEDKLLALAHKRVGIDVGFVLSGRAVSAAATSVVMAQLRLAALKVAKDGGTDAEQFARAAELVEAVNAPLPADEELLLDAYRAMDSDTKKRLLASVLKGSFQDAPAAAKPGNANSTSQTFHGTVDSVAGRDVVKTGKPRGRK